VVDLFDEVEEELRTERYSSLVRRIAPWVTAVLTVLLVAYLGYWGWTVYQARQAARAAAEYQKGLDALQQSDPTGAFSQFEAAAKDGSPAYKTLALMEEGGIRQAAGKADEAASLFGEAARAAPNPLLGDLASLRAGLAVLDTAPLPQIEARLRPLTDAKRPFALYAKEALAMAELRAGRTADARRDFSGVSISLGASDEMRQRARMAVAVIDSGEAPTVIKAVQIAATLPPPGQTSVAPPPDAQSPGGAPASQPGANQ
jgi:hypothetical protein